MEGLRIVKAALVEGAWVWGTPGAPRVWGSCSQPPPPLASTQPPRPARAAGAGGCRGSWSGARVARGAWGRPHRGQRSRQNNTDRWRDNLKGQ